MTVWLFGDSILKGAALRSLCARNPEEIQFLFRPPELMQRLSGVQFQRGGETNVSNKPGKGARRIATMLKRREISRGDAIVLLDVGEHSSNPDEHEEHWKRLVGAACKPGVRVLVCEGFDAGAYGNASCQYDTIFGDRTMNDAIWSAANGADWLPLSEPIRDYCAQLQLFGRTGFLRDEIHPDVFCQLRICRLILGALDIPIGGRKSLCDLIVSHWKPLRANSAADAKQMALLALA